MTPREPPGDARRLLVERITELKRSADRIDESGNLDADLRTLWRGKSIAYDCVLNLLEVALSPEAVPSAPADFPVMSDRAGEQYPKWIPWSLAEKAYSVYSKRFPGSAAVQSLERIAQRGGFYTSELDEYVPGWHAIARQGPSAPAGLRERLLKATEVVQYQAIAELLRDAAASLDGQGDAAALPAPIDLVRQRATDFAEGYRAGHDEGLDGAAADSEAAWCKSKASAELARLKTAGDAAALPDLDAQHEYRMANHYHKKWQQAERRAEATMGIVTELLAEKAAGDAAPLPEPSGDYKTHQCGPETFRKP